MTEYNEVESGVSVFDGKPFVKITMTFEGSRRPRSKQLRPDEARAMGIQLVEAAIEAERDAGTVHFMAGEPPWSDEGQQSAARMLLAIREHRQKFESDNK